MSPISHAMDPTIQSVHPVLSTPNYLWELWLSAKRFVLSSSFICACLVLTHMISWTVSSPSLTGLMSRAPRNSIRLLSTLSERDHSQGTGFHSAPSMSPNTRLRSNGAFMLASLVIRWTSRCSTKTRCAVCWRWWRRRGWWRGILQIFTMCSAANAEAYLDLPIDSTTRTVHHLAREEIEH